MKLISFLVLIFSFSNTFAKQKCQNVQELFEKAQSQAYDELPEGLIDTSLNVDFENTEICENDKNEITIITSDKQASVRHLVLIGPYFGYGLIGFDGTYQRVNKNGGYRDHFRILTNYFPNLWAGGGFQYARHINGSIFYYGANANYLRLYNNVNNYAVGGFVGLEGGKGIVSGFLQLGVRTAFEGDLVETMPLIGFGLRFRIFRR